MIKKFRVSYTEKIVVIVNALDASDAEDKAINSYEGRVTETDIVNLNVEEL